MTLILHVAPHADTSLRRRHCAIGSPHRTFFDRHSQPAPYAVSAPVPRRLIPAAQGADWYARRVGVAAARDINTMPAARHSTRRSIVRAAGIPRFRRNLGIPRAGLAGGGAQNQNDTRIPQEDGYMRRANRAGPAYPPPFPLRRVGRPDLSSGQKSGLPA
jgi:hypothetical protein